MFEYKDTNSTSLSTAQKLINDEMLVLMIDDNKNHPLKGMKASKLPNLNV